MNKAKIPNDGHETADLPVFVSWMQFMNWLLDRTERFPKRVRHTISERIERLALDVVEDLVEARYSRKKQEHLRSVNLRLEKLRVLIRISHHRRYLSGSQYRFAARELHDIGSMIGGWLRYSERS